MGRWYANRSTHSDLVSWLLRGLSREAFPGSVGFIVQVDPVRLTPVKIVAEIDLKSIWLIAGRNLRGK